MDERVPEQLELSPPPAGRAVDDPSPTSIPSLGSGGIGMENNGCISNANNYRNKETERAVDLTAFLGPGIAFLLWAAGVEKPGPCGATDRCRPRPDLRNGSSRCSSRGLLSLSIHGRDGSSRCSSILFIFGKILTTGTRSDMLLARLRSCTAVGGRRNSGIAEWGCVHVAMWVAYGLSI